MLNYQRAVNYANALFDVEGTLEQIHIRQDDLEKLGDLIASSPEMIHFLGSPDIHLEEKFALLEKLLQRSLDPSVKKLIALVIKRRMVAQIKQIATEYHKLVVYSLKEIDVEVTSASPFDAQTKQKLQKKLEERLDKKVNMIERVNPTLLGGFTILIHNQMLDLSVRGKLTNLKKRLLKAKV